MDWENITEKEFLEQVNELLTEEPEVLMQTLIEIIRICDNKCERCIYIIKLLKTRNATDILTTYRCRENQTVLHIAAAFHTCGELIPFIVDACPDLISAQCTGEFEGKNFLHMLIAKDAFSIAKQFLHHASVSESLKTKCIFAKATGSKFANTVLMGETVLSVAALKFNAEMFMELFNFGASVKDQNSKGDTVLHTLIRYVHANEQYLDTMLKFLDFLQGLMLEPKNPPEHRWGIRYMKTVWFTENNEHQTPLQLAACLGEDKIFTYIMNLQWVYRVLCDYDGLFGSNKYDITEVDTLAKLKYLKDRRNATFFPRSRPNRLTNTVRCFDAVLIRQSSPSILDTVCQTDIHAACRIIQSPVLQTVLENKWKHYQKFFLIWAILHFLGTISLSVYANYKIRYTNWVSGVRNFTSENGDVFLSNMTQLVNDTMGGPAISSSHKFFVLIYSSILFCPAMLFLFLEYVRTFVQRRPWNLLLAHHNGKYRLVHLLLYLCLFLDSFWFLISPSTNPIFIIILAVLLSWYFLMFFIRPYKIFSLYTVMLQKVVIGDMLRFSTVILLEMASHAIAMRLLFLHNQPLPSEFRSFSQSFLTMFKLMLGFRDLEIFNKADPEWLAILLFVSYILATCVLLMNSLIAMMSNTCSETENDEVNIWQIQRLSVILFMENLLMVFGWATTLGKKHYILKYRNEKETRYVIEVSEGLTPSIRGADIARWRDHMRQESFGVDLSVRPLLSKRRGHLERSRLPTLHERLSSSLQNDFADIKEKSTADKMESTTEGPVSRSMSI